MIIKFKGRLQYFDMSSDEYSQYPNEKEVLMQDGIQFKVIEFNEWKKS